MSMHLSTDARDAAAIRQFLTVRVAEAIPFLLVARERPAIAALLRMQEQLATTPDAVVCAIAERVEGLILAALAVLAPSKGSA